MPHIIKNFLFYIGFFLFVGGVFNVLFHLIPDYQLTITYISYGGFYMMMVGSPYPPKKDLDIKDNDKDIDRVSEDLKD